MLLPFAGPSAGADPYLGDGASISAVCPCLMLKTLNKLTIRCPISIVSSTGKSHPVAALIACASSFKLALLLNLQTPKQSSNWVAPLPIAFQVTASSDEVLAAFDGFTESPKSAGRCIVKPVSVVMGTRRIAFHSMYS